MFLQKLEGNFKTGKLFGISFSRSWNTALCTKSKLSLSICVVCSSKTQLNVPACLELRCFFSLWNLLYKDKFGDARLGRTSLPILIEFDIIQITTFPRNLRLNVIARSHQITLCTFARRFKSVHLWCSVLMVVSGWSWVIPCSSSIIFAHAKVSAWTYWFGSNQCIPYNFLQKSCNF